MVSNPSDAGPSLPEPFTPEQEERIKALIRELFDEINQAVIRRLNRQIISSRNIRNEHQHAVPTVTTDEAHEMAERPKHSVE
jgi:hypothetical protein